MQRTPRIKFVRMDHHTPPCLWGDQHLTTALLLFLGPGLASSAGVQQELRGALDAIPAILRLHLAAQQALVDALGEILEGVGDVEARLGRNLRVGRAQLLGQLLGFLAAHHSLPFSIQVALLAHQHKHDGVRLHVLAHLSVPLLDVVKGLAVTDVKHQQASS